MSTTPGADPGNTPQSSLSGGFGPAGGPPGGQAIPPGPAGPVTTPAAAGGAVPPGIGPAAVTVGSYQNYADAQRAVDYLSDNGFPVQHSAIIGTDLRLVETVTGRLTIWRAALAGVASGAWFGLFFGLILGIFTNVNWFGVIIATVLIGAAWGAIFGAIAHAATGGRRDFSSRSSLQASRYDVTVQADTADQARHMLVQMNWRASGAS
ncbi:MAG TPA: general stress protein [Micromonosporaceae bacterium]|jgi:hypothetical protein|nr:general stress protein [Micromonosporaceae bacterium]HKE64599.1 general stress protein [Micromonosporaceae bacterium]